MDKHRIVLATSNAGKLKELSALLQPFHLEVLPQSQFNIEDAEENGLTFIENALIKARHASAKTGLPALADDSGISVDALNGEPGIHSARFAGINAPNNVRIAKLLERMHDVADDMRSATFNCVLVYINHPADPVPLICHGQLHGKILRETRGHNGFGYDPVFFLPSYNKTVAELPAEEKNKISHRALALQQFIRLLPDKL